MGPLAAALIPAGTSILGSVLGSIFGGDEDKKQQQSRGWLGGPDGAGVRAVGGLGLDQAKHALNNLFDRQPLDQSVLWSFLGPMLAQNALQKHSAKRLMTDASIQQGQGAESGNILQRLAELERVFTDQGRQMTGQVMNPFIANIPDWRNQTMSAIGNFMSQGVGTNQTSSQSTQMGLGTALGQAATAAGDALLKWKGNQGGSVGNGTPAAQAFWEVASRQNDPGGIGPIPTPGTGVYGPGF